MLVRDDTLSLVPGAPQWQFVKLGAATPRRRAGPTRCPARVAIDPARPSRVSAPLAGRITRVFVELGNHVLACQPLLSVASPELAELLAEEAKAKLACVLLALEQARDSLGDEHRAGDNGNQKP